jgi:hypothetical protein
LQRGGGSAQSQGFGNCGRQLLLKGGHTARRVFVQQVSYVPEIERHVCVSLRYRNHWFARDVGHTYFIEHVRISTRAIRNDDARSNNRCPDVCDDLVSSEKVVCARPTLTIRKASSLPVAQPQHSY